MKLGDALVQEKLINRAQLSKALERQVIMGGRLGTSLIELGYINEIDLVNCLSKLRQVPYAPFTAFLNLSPEVIKLIPKELAVKYKIIPLKKERNQIHLAMADPADLHSIDEIKFILGSAVVPYVASELRVQMALEKYYDLPRERRYIDLTTRLEERPSPQAPPPKPAAETRDEVETVVYEPRAATLRPIDAVSRELVGIANREELGQIILRFARIKLKRVVLFIIRENKAFGWMGAGSELFLDAISHLEVDLRQPSVLSDVVGRKAFFRGTLLPMPGNDHLMQNLGEARPREVLAYPITIKGKTVMVLYGDDGNQSLLMGDYDDLKRLMLKASMALEVLIMRHKILEMD